jgi:uncharacterized membrane protein YsdA (DUF1294 family)
LVTVLAFRADKDRARRHRAQQRGPAPPRRIPERDLLLLALLGGTPGAYLARRAFRHKTRKQPFSSKLHGIALLQLAGLSALAWHLAQGHV